MRAMIDRWVQMSPEHPFEQDRLGDDSGLWIEGGPDRFGFAWHLEHRHWPLVLVEAWRGDGDKIQVGIFRKDDLNDPLRDGRQIPLSVLPLVSSAIESLTGCDSRIRRLEDLLREALERALPGGLEDQDGCVREGEWAARLFSAARKELGE